MKKEHTFSLLSRNNFIDSKEANNKSFISTNRFKESWAGMYSFFVDKPTENDTMFGNFNFEIDEDNFFLLKEKILMAIEYLQKKYKIKREDFFFQVTNRSIWVSIPAKVFDNYGKKNLHIIHKQMANEINTYLLTKYDKGLDLSIYRWNGLMRTLGSFLPKIKNWVTKFDLIHLEEADSFDVLRKATFDNFYTIRDVEVNPIAKEWFNSFDGEKQKSKSKETLKTKAYRHLGMDKFIENGELDFNRNLHIYSMSLYLKDKGLSFDQIKEKLINSFANPYLRTREAIRTMKSAAFSNKHFSPSQMRGSLDDSIFNEGSYITNRDTFIVPRTFIEGLQAIKANHQSYKLLLQILMAKQVEGINFTMDLKGLKHKKNTLQWFEKIKEAGVIQYVVSNDIVTTEIVRFEENIYKSHIVVPTELVKTKSFKNLGRELILLCEIWRSGYKQEAGHIHFNTKAKTLCKTLRLNKSTYFKYLSRLKKEHLVAGKKAFLDQSKKVRKNKCAKVMQLFLGGFKAVRESISMKVGGAVQTVEVRDISSIKDLINLELLTKIRVTTRSHYSQSTPYNKSYNVKIVEYR